jgi:hypothetical protein
VLDLASCLQFLEENWSSCIFAAELEVTTEAHNTRVRILKKLKIKILKNIQGWWIHKQEGSSFQSHQ